MGTLINIDNGGTLTDICVWDGNAFTFTKTLTTPHDLSECLFTGIEKASNALYGEADITKLLHATEHIRYSTTQGTNALVERRGPMIGILTTIGGLATGMQRDDAEKKLFTGLVGDRFLTVATEGDLEFDAVQKINRLTTLGAARVVVAAATPEEERQLRHVLLRKFPRHLLGSVPLIYSWELAGDRNDARRVWSCVVNAFLHPTMERFLYSAERRLQTYKVVNPLLVYRNDGASSRVAKSIALKTYSSGPRGGLEGTAALAQVYGLPHALMMDIGGTTTDVGVVEGGAVAVAERGGIEGVSISYPMSDVTSSVATQLSSQLFGVVYVLDEPSAGLHPRDRDALLGILEGLKRRGNSVFVVEHSLDIIGAADWLVDIGPDAGENGGQILYSGPPKGLAKIAESATRRYLFGLAPPVIRAPREPSGWLRQPQPLQFAGRQRRGAAVQRQVAETQIHDRLQPLKEFAHQTTGGSALFDGHVRGVPNIGRRLVR